MEDDLSYMISTYLFEPSGCFSRHPCAGRDPGHLADRFLDSAKASLRVPPPAQHHTGAGTRE